MISLFRPLSPLDDLSGRPLVYFFSNLFDNTIHDEHLISMITLSCCYYPHLYTKRNWGIERSYNFPKIKQIVSHDLTLRLCSFGFQDLKITII